MKKVELLSPAGNIEMLKQAIHNGCDAVYLSGTKYGARAFARNFTNEELSAAIKYSHLYGVKVYVTINTLIYENEVQDFIEYVKFLYEEKVDAVLMQDVGMISLVKELYPNLEIHASTQLNNTSQSQINLLEELNVKRVVLSRELSLKEIKEIKTPLEKEVFVYGALCICYSGCCLFSSLNGGRSANRGECTGPCRMPYKLYKNSKEVSTEGDYLLSMKDLNTLANLKSLLESGIASLKIEGRMKSEAYVGYVTKLYRTLIDKYYNNEELTLTNEEEVNLKKLFNREFTKGFLFNEHDVTNIKAPNHQGILLGKVIKIDDKYIYIELFEDLNQEDAIRFKDSNTGMIVNRLYDKNKYLVNSVKKGSVVLIDKKVSATKEEQVLKTLDKHLIDSLEKYEEKKIPVTYSAIFKINKPFEIVISDGENTIKEEGAVVENAKTMAITKENIIKSLKKLGNTPFKEEDITINMDDNIFVSLKDINEIRRNLTDKLISLRENPKKEIIINEYKEKPFIKGSDKTLNALVRTEEQLKACQENKLDNIYVESYELYEKYKNNKNIFYRLDRVETKEETFKHENLLVEELGQIYKYKENNLVGDYFLNVTNHYTILALNNLNVKKVTLSVELDFDKIKDIMQNSYNVEVIIYGRLELMITKYCLLKKCLNYCSTCKSTDTFYLKDKNNNNYPLLRKNCFTHIMHYKNIDKINDIKSYQNINVTNFRIELFDENYEDVCKLIKAIKCQM